MQTRTLFVLRETASPSEVGVHTFGRLHFQLNKVLPSYKPSSASKSDFKARHEQRKSQSVKSYQARRGTLMHKLERLAAGKLLELSLGLAHDVGGWKGGLTGLLWRLTMPGRSSDRHSRFSTKSGRNKPLEHPNHESNGQPQ